MKAGTPYEGREDEFDLGNGCSFTWMYDSRRQRDDGAFPIGLIEHHPKPESGPGLYCGGYIAWAPSEGLDQMSYKHELISGSPGDEEHLTVRPSLLCRTCGNHGFIRDRAWVPA